MNWYAVYTKSRQERIAQENLERQSFETYLPLMVLSRKRRGEWVETVEPIFSRYLFIRLEPVGEFADIAQREGKSVSPGRIVTGGRVSNQRNAVLVGTTNPRIGAVEFGERPVESRVT